MTQEFTTVPSDTLALEVMRMTAEITRTIVDKLPMLVEAAAALHRTRVDDAALHARFDAAIPPLDPATIAHFVAVQAALKPDEALLARAVAADLAPRELRMWFDALKQLRIPDAVAKIRAQLAELE